jgi:hypothetical protein
MLIFYQSHTCYGATSSTPDVMHNRSKDKQAMSNMWGVCSNHVKFGGNVLI